MFPCANQLFFLSFAGAEFTRRRKSFAPRMALICLASSMRRFGSCSSAASLHSSLQRSLVLFGLMATSRRTRLIERTNECALHSKARTSSQNMHKSVLHFATVLVLRVGVGGRWMVCQRA